MNKKEDPRRWLKTSVSILIALQVIDFITTSILVKLSEHPNITGMEHNPLFSYLFQYFNPLFILFIVKLTFIGLIILFYKKEKRDNILSIIIINVINTIYTYTMIKHTITITLLLSALGIV